MSYQPTWNVRMCNLRLKQWRSFALLDFLLTIGSLRYTRLDFALELNSRTNNLLGDASWPSSTLAAVQLICCSTATQTHKERRKQTEWAHKKCSMLIALDRSGGLKKDRLLFVCFEVPFHICLPICISEFLVEQELICDSHTCPLQCLHYHARPNDIIVTLINYIRAARGIKTVCVSVRAHLFWFFHSLRMRWNAQVSNEVC